MRRGWVWRGKVGEEMEGGERKDVGEEREVGGR